MSDIYDNLINTPLIEAVRTGQLSRVKELIDGGADVNEPGEQGWTPLSWAAGKGKLELVTLLIANGADVFKVGRDQRTPNMIAVAAGHIEVVKFLREAEELVAEKPSRSQRKYCRAYYLKDLYQFANANEKEFDDTEIVFLHEDNTVSQSAWSNANIIFNNETPEWREFRSNQLQFKVTEDLDLITIVEQPS